MMTPLKITDAIHTPDMANDGKTFVNQITPEYSTVTPWSLNDKWLLLAGNSHFLLHDGLTGKFLRPLKASNANEWIASRSQPRWSRGNPDAFYFLIGNALKLFNVVTMTSMIVRHFPEYSKIDGMGEGDMLSDDGKLMALCGDDSEVFTLNMDTLAKNQVVILPKVESLYLTPKANNVLVGYHGVLGSDRLKGVELFDKNMRFIRQILTYNPHKDVALNAAGEEIFIHGNGAAQIVMTSLNMTVPLPQKPIFKSTPGLAEHISCPISQPFFFMDRYDPKNVIPGDILKVWLDGHSEVLALHGSKSFPDNTNSYQPKVSCNRTGTRIIYGSNNGIGVPPRYSDVYMVNLAADEKPLPTPVPAPTETLTYNLSKYKWSIIDGVLTMKAKP